VRIVYKEQRKKGHLEGNYDVATEEIINTQETFLWSKPNK